MKSGEFAAYAIKIWALPTGKPINLDLSHIHIARNVMNSKWQNLRMNRIEKDDYWIIKWILRPLVITLLIAVAINEFLKAI